MLADSTSFKQGLHAILDRPAAERPREQLISQGPERLSDRELLEAILGSGTKRYPVTVLANMVLDVIDKSRKKPDALELSKLPGLGKAKAALIIAMLEFGRRHWGERKRRIQMPEDAWAACRHLGDRQQEHFIVISLNGAHEIIALRIISVGLVNRTVVHPREVFAESIVDRASAIIIAHNHPSGSLSPSKEDIDITERLKEAGNLIGIEILDHLIFDSSGFYSFLKEGRLT